VSASLALAPAAPLWAAAGTPQTPLAEAALGIGSIVVTLFYTPAKLLYAGGASVTAVSAYAITAGRKDVFWDIMGPALRGDYVVTPQHLQFQRQLVFMGPSPEDIALANAEFLGERLPMYNGSTDY
jgi:hypothetical protein